MSKRTLPFLLLLTLSAAVRAEEAARPDHDVFLTSLAQLLAGRTPESPMYERWTSTAAWREHKAFFDENWARAKKYRFNRAAAWRDKELKLPAGSSTTLMYPFSGPDFLNANLFFPGADRAIFYSLEPAGRLPDLSAMQDQEFAALLADIRDALGDIFKRHYFITKNMDAEMRTPYLKGNRTILLVFMALTGHQVVSLEDVTLSSAGAVVPLVETAVSTAAASTATAAARPLKGVRIGYRAPGGPERSLLYFSLDATDKGLRKHPAFVPFLRASGPAVTFIKSASYLLHDNQFAEIRKVILETSDAVMQDDSGMPLRFFAPAEWTVALYGKYTEPIKDFNYGHQEDLQEAYEAPGAAKPLPFKFGYHWWDGYSNVQVATRKPRAVASAAPASLPPASPAADPSTPNKTPTTPLP